jgi:hypothetical protein
MAKPSVTDRSALFATELRTSADRDGTAFTKDRSDRLVADAIVLSSRAKPGLLRSGSDLRPTLPRNQWPFDGCRVAPHSGASL